MLAKVLACSLNSMLLISPTPRSRRWRPPHWVSWSFSNSCADLSSSRRCLAWVPWCCKKLFKRGFDNSSEIEEFLLEWFSLVLERKWSFIWIKLWLKGNALRCIQRWISKMLWKSFYWKMGGGLVFKIYDNYFGQKKPEPPFRVAVDWEGIPPVGVCFKLMLGGWSLFISYGF